MSAMASLRLRRGPPIAPNDPFANCDWSFVFIETPLGGPSDGEFSFYFSNYSDLTSRAHLHKDRDRIRFVGGRSLCFLQDAERNEWGPDNHAIMIPDPEPGSKLSPITVRICSGGDTNQYESPSLYNFVPRFQAEVKQNVQLKTCWQFVLRFKFESVDFGVQIVPVTRQFTKTSPVKETAAWMDSVQVHVKHDGGDFAIAAAFQFIDPQAGVGKLSGFHFVQPHLFRIGMVMKDEDLWDEETCILKSVYTVHLRPCLAPAPIPTGIRAQFIDPNATIAFQEWHLAQTRLQLQKLINDHPALGAQPDRQLVKALGALDALVTRAGNMRRRQASDVSHQEVGQARGDGQSSHVANSSGEGNRDLFGQMIIPSPEEVRNAGCLDPTLLSLPEGSINDELNISYFDNFDNFDTEDLVNYEPEMAFDNIDWNLPVDTKDTNITMNGAVQHDISNMHLPQMTSAEDKQLHDWLLDTNAAATAATTAPSNGIPFDFRSNFEEAMYGPGQQEDLPDFTSILYHDSTDFMTDVGMEWAAQDLQASIYPPVPTTPPQSVFSTNNTPPSTLTTMPSSRPELKRAAPSDSPSDRPRKVKRANTSSTEQSIEAEICAKSSEDNEVEQSF